jgi:integrase
MNVRKVRTREGVRWEVRGRLGGRGSKSIRRRFVRKEDAQRWATDQIRAKQLGEVVVSTRLTLDEYAAEWWTNYAEKELAPKTRLMYGALWRKHVQSSIAKVPLARLSIPVASKFQRDLQVKGVGGPTILKTLTMLQSICRQAQIDGLIRENPFKPLRKPSQRPARAGVRLSPSEVEALRQQMPTARDKALVSLLAYAGLRPGEALALAWGDIRDNTISVTKALSLGREKGTKTGAVRAIRLLAPLAEELRALRPVVRLVHDEDGQLGADDGARIFTMRDGRAWTDEAYRNWRTRVFKPAATKAGFDGIRPYDLRGSFCSLLLAGGVNLAEIADEAGNSVEVLSSNYFGVIKELRGKPLVDPVRAIRAARVSSVRHRARQEPANQTRKAANLAISPS